ncbi:gem-associated protein 7-like [Bombus impatiens]|uniref:Gem-associated protein 7-like n=2 Tax=Pyrobombus TaxID=144703 RepID=A0A6P8LCS8_BOMIM|nr:gem-associated protein 7-like [Bombus impatiens]XP_033176307.1 gem-associated protein 7-like [Bombus impatiens]XP_033194322.1 gem-associated protein 7-like [Bombus vancouverensis nearcticus]XP_033299150.1 gem-associated protein 7-like [Bombus bifarius]XP_050476866.1 gem-associated protein 7-like [Bombus huntii]
MTGSVEDSTHLNDNINVEFATPEKQEARAFLRERFLRVITGIVGKQAEFYLYENTQVSAQFRGCDVDCLEVFVRNLETPLGTIPEAVLRASDIIYLNIHDINKE